MLPNTDRVWVEELVKELENTTVRVYKLLEEINESKVELASIKTQLLFFVENVKDLSKLVCSGQNGNSVLTKLAVLGQSVDELKGIVSSSSSYSHDLAIRITLLEENVKKINELRELVLKEHIKNQTSLQSNSTNEITLKTQKWKLYTGAIAAIVTMLGSIIATLLSFLK